MQLLSDVQYFPPVCSSTTSLLVLLSCSAFDLTIHVVDQIRKSLSFFVTWLLIACMRFDASRAAWDQGALEMSLGGFLLLVLHKASDVKFLLPTGFSLFFICYLCDTHVIPIPSLRQDYCLSSL